MKRANSDAGKLRNALALSNFNATKTTIFSDKRKHGRRLKLWNGNEVFKSKQDKQQTLEKHLREAFGKRIISMYFIKTWYMSKSLCIKLKEA